MSKLDMGVLVGLKAELLYFLQCVTDGATVERCVPGESALAVQYALR